MNKVLGEYYDIRDKHDGALRDLEDEVSRIVAVLKKVFKHKDAWWSFKYYDADNDFPLPQKLEDDGKVFPIFIDGDFGCGDRDYSGGIPVTFFDMTDEEIKKQLEDEVEKSIQEEENRKEIEKRKRETRNLNKKKLLDSAAGKLTKEERKALGL